MYVGGASEARLMVVPGAAAGAWREAWGPKARTLACQDHREPAA